MTNLVVMAFQQIEDQYPVPLQDVNVAVDGLQGVTDVSGKTAAFTGLVEGQSYNVSLSKSGFVSVAASIVAVGTDMMRGWVMQVSEGQESQPECPFPNLKPFPTLYKAICQLWRIIKNWI